MVPEELTSMHEPTWDVEVSRSLLIGGGRRPGVGVHGEAWGATATFAASRWKSRDSI